MIITFEFLESIDY